MGARASFWGGAEQPGGTKGRSKQQAWHKSNTSSSSTGGGGSVVGGSGSSSSSGRTKLSFKPGLLQFQSVDSAAQPAKIAVKPVSIRSDRVSNFRELLAGSKIAKALNISSEAIDEAAIRRFGAPSGIVGVSGSASVYVQANSGPKEEENDQKEEF